jgi:dienelactone hydrolase
MLDSVPDLHAWTLFPTGMSPWSGDDWHTWGLADVRAAVLAISDWMEAIGWDGPGVCTHKWLVTGHSNGGQGTWHFLTHQPDRVVAAAAVSGYLSIQTYVPYSMWRQALPSLTAIVHQAMSSFRHELLTANMAGIPIIVQHGSSDENVPPYHSRLMNSLLGEIGADVNYVELPNHGHWFEGAMATSALQKFYRQHLTILADANLPPITFSAVFPSTDDMGCRWGIAVDQLESPDFFGRIDVSRSGKTWWLSTTNIHRLHFDFASSQIDPPNAILLDGSEVAWVDGSDPRPTTSFVKSTDGPWEAETDGKWKALQQRHGRQRGVLDAIMRTLGSFKIMIYSNNTLDVALQISRNLYQYYHADSSIINCSSRDANQTGNLISLAVGTDLPAGELETFPINILPTGIEIRRSHRSPIQVIPHEAGLGAIFLRPLGNEQLELVVWGSDQSGLRQVARLVPTLTGVGQADFIILSKRAAWQGHAGAIAMGFFDFEWQISEGSYIS